jgi:hypothetical protein
MIKFSGILFCFLLASCQSKVKTPDISTLKLDTSLIRFEQELFAGDTTEVEGRIERLVAKYPDFTDVFIYQIIADANFDNDGVKSATVFVRDSFIRALNDTCQSLYGDFSKYESELVQALKYFKFYFPEKATPAIYTCVSGFEVGSFTIGDNILGIGLDFYLGADYPKYHPDLFPNYIKASMTSDYLVAKSIQALIANHLGEASGTRLLDFMIRNGIELYIKQKLLPFEKEEIIYEYNTEQMDWLRQNESQIWAHLMQEDLLYSVNFRTFQKIINPSPSVPNMPAEAPGRLGNWIGAKIVESYMARHSNMSLSDLITMKDAQKILAESKYKPRQ